MSTQNYWTKSQLDFLHKLKAQCLEYGEFNRKQVNKYTTTNTHFNIPILVLSGLNSFVALGLQPFVKQEYISIINSVLSLTCGILSSTALYMKYNEKINTCVSCSHDLNDLHATIFKELSLDEDSRSMDGKDFCNKMFDEYTKIMQKHLVPKKHIQMFLLTDKEKQYNDVSTLQPKISSSTNTEDLYEYTKEPQENKAPTHEAEKYEAEKYEADDNEPDENELNDIEKDQPQLRGVNESKQSSNLFSLFGSYST
jgi:hypothetical protein